MARPAPNAESTPKRGGRAARKSSVSGTTDIKPEAGSYIIYTSGNYATVSDWTASVSNGILTVSATVKVSQDDSSIENLTLQVMPTSSQGGAFVSMSTLGNEGYAGPASATLQAAGGPVDFVPSQVASKISGSVITSQGPKPLGRGQYPQYPPNSYEKFYYQVLTVST